mmetsp:Transcript_115023/g.256941  ORF Transcript_115023/g.256941 Transcript_115023/m.256941 type:complete len:95 (-) Transcript_115023:993-1277(-)
MQRWSPKDGVQLDCRPVAKAAGFRAAARPELAMLRRDASDAFAAAFALAVADMDGVRGGGGAVGAEDGLRGPSLPGAAPAKEPQVLAAARRMSE